MTQCFEVFGERVGQLEGQVTSSETLQGRCQPLCRLRQTCLRLPLGVFLKTLSLSLGTSAGVRGFFFQVLFADSGLTKHLERRCHGTKLIAPV
ncbi:hypothetical protein D3C80_1243730 [compost metagenome]